MSWETAKELFSSDLVRNLWDAFEIQALVVTSLGFQMILAICGRRRKYRTGIYVGFIVWFSYLMGTYVSTVALGKLTETNANSRTAISNITYGDVHVTNNELRAMWAPLLLVHIGGPDGITAYAVEDNRLGVRQFIELGVQIFVVLSIFIKSWNNSWLSIISLTLLVGGAIKSFERIWCLRCSASSDAVFNRWAQISSVPGLELLVKAYRRFEHLKPHLQNWIGHPSSINVPSMSTYCYDPEDIFKIAELELSFMFDVLYTRSPTNYSSISFVRRFICFTCLVCSLCGFAILFRHADVQLIAILFAKKYDKRVDIAITYVLLAGAIAIELYALATILYSDWALLYMIKGHRTRFGRNLLELLARQIPMHWDKWSNRMEQLNLLKCCQYRDPALYGRIVSRFLSLLSPTWKEKFKRYRATRYAEIRPNLKKLIIQQMEEVSGQRVWQPFSKRGEWALERLKCLDQFKWSIQTDYTTEANQQTSFGRAIIIWHIATDVWFNAPVRIDNITKNTKQLSEMAKYLSDYMLYLLAERPVMLSIVTKNVLFESASTQLTAYLEGIKSTKTTTESMARCFSRNLLEGGFKNAASDDQALITVDDVANRFHTGTAIVSDWDVVVEAKLLAELLMDREDRWVLLTSIWVEMLFYAASNCSWMRHTEQLRRGGGLITHVWLLLLHETNKFNISLY